MVNITDVKQILQFAIDAEIKVFLDGGWGVDALLGYQSRAHNDIDIFVEIPRALILHTCWPKRHTEYGLQQTPWEHQSLAFLMLFSNTWSW